jgi:hypothetical protein
MGFDRRLCCHCTSPEVVLSGESPRCEGSDAIGGIADLSERLVQTNSVENDPSATLAVHCGNGFNDLMPVSAPIKVLV